MDLFEMLKNRENQLINTNKLKDEFKLHPLSSLKFQFRYAYSFGIAIIGIGYIKNIDELQKNFEKFIESMSLPKNSIDKLLIDLNEHFELFITKILTYLKNEKQYQYFFIADLIKISFGSSWAENYCKNVIDNFAQMLKLNEVEIKFLYDYIIYGKDGKEDIANRLYQNFIKKGYKIDYKLLNYINPHFILKDEFDFLHFSDGKKHVIDRETIVKDDIELTNGSILVVNRANIKIGGSIIVDGARLHLDHSNIVAIDGNEEPMFIISNVHRVTIRNCEIDCNFKKSFLYQLNGDLYIYDTNISHTKNIYALNFKAENLVINDTNFFDCLNGAIKITNEASFSSDKCKFFNCNADQGGAINANTRGDIIILNPEFNNCKAKFLGGCVYFAFKRYGQVVKNYKIVDCQPIEDQIFNNYNEIEE